MNSEMLLKLSTVGVLSLGGLALDMQQVSSQEIPVITLDEAVDRSLLRSPVLAQADQGVGVAAEGFRSAWAQFIPSLTGSSSFGKRSSERFDADNGRVVSGSANSYSYGLSSNLLLFDGGERRKEMTRTRANVNAAEARRSDQRWSVIVQTKNFFFTALRQAELLEVARSRIAQAEESLELTRTRARVGAATSSDTLRTKLELVNSRQAVLNAEVALRAAQFALGRQVGLGRPVAPAPPGNLAPSTLGATAEELLLEAEGISPAVIAAAAATAAAVASVGSAKTQWFPTVSLSGGYNWSNTVASFNDLTRSWNLNFSLNYPLFNRFNRESGIANAQYAQRVAQMQEDDIRLAARQETDAALRNLTSAEQSIAIAEEAQAVAEEDLRVVRERYQVGVAIILDVITSQVALDQARVDLVEARYDYVLARAALEEILGREL